MAPLPYAPEREPVLDDRTVTLAAVLFVAAFALTMCLLAVLA